MAIIVFNTSRPVAKRSHECSACRIINESEEALLKMNETQKSIYLKAKTLNFMIVKGEEYIKIEYKKNDEFKTYKARPEMDRLCKALNLFTES